MRLQALLLCGLLVAGCWLRVSAQEDCSEQALLSDLESLVTISLLGDADIRSGSGISRFSGSGSGSSGSELGSGSSGSSGGSDANQFSGSGSGGSGADRFSGSGSGGSGADRFSGSGSGGSGVNRFSGSGSGGSGVNRFSGSGFSGSGVRVVVLESQIVCLAAAEERGQYRFASVVVNYTCEDSGEGVCPSSKP